MYKICKLLNIDPYQASIDNIDINELIIKSIEDLTMNKHNRISCLSIHRKSYKFTLFRIIINNVEFLREIKIGDYKSYKSSFLSDIYKDFYNNTKIYLNGVELNEIEKFLNDNLDKTYKEINYKNAKIIQ